MNQICTDFDLKLALRPVIIINKTLVTRGSVEAVVCWHWCRIVTRIWLPLFHLIYPPHTTIIILLHPLPGFLTPRLSLLFYFFSAFEISWSFLYAESDYSTLAGILSREKRLTVGKGGGVRDFTTTNSHSRCRGGINSIYYDFNFN